MEQVKNEYPREGVLPRRFPRRVGGLPRELIGVGGVRLYNIPGVIYPASMLRECDRKERGMPIILQRAPSWAISTRQAAELLNCRPASARELLHRERVRFCRVAIGNYPPTVYWDKSRVRALVRRRKPVISVRPSRLVDSAEALAILGVSRNSLSRYARVGMLQRFRLRYLRSDGARLTYFYLRSEVEKLRMHRSASRSAISRTPLTMPSSEEREKRRG